MRWLADIEFKTSEGVFWWPFYIEAESPEKGTEFFQRNLAALAERYKITRSQLTQETAMNQAVLREYRQKAFHGTPYHLDIHKWVLAYGDQKVETNPLLNFNENIDFTIWETGHLRGVEVGRNRFPVRLKKPEEWFRLDDPVHLVINLVL